MIQVLPDAVQGWFLLDKCGLDPMERSVIQGDIKSNFTLAGVENSLRSHWTDEQLRRRDGEARNQTFFQEEDDNISEPDYEPEDAFFQGWSDQEVAWYQDAREQEQQAWIQLQQARRTLKDARARQSEVKMSRRFYRPGNGKGNAKSRGPVGAAPQPGPCLRCGRAHRTADCPSKGNSSEEKTLEAEHLAEFTFYQQGDNAEDIAATTPLANTHQESPDEQHDFYNEVFVVEGGQHVTTEMAIQHGKAILDPGATRSMGSLHAVEALLNVNMAQRGDSGIRHVSLDERPTFGFGNSQKSRAMSTCYIRVPSEKQPLNFRVHVIPDGQAPILMSIDTLRRLGAIIDYGKDQAIFTNLCPKTLVSLERSQLGHQLLPLGADFLSHGRPLPRAVMSLEQLSE